MEFGVQTFTIRKAQKKSIRSAYLPLIRLGIKRFEVARIDFNEKNAKEIRALVDEYGIEVCSIQVKPKYVFGDIDNVVKFCEIVECKNVVISMLPFKCVLGGEDKLAYLREFFNEEHYDIREGEVSLTKVWFEFCARKMALEDGLTSPDSEQLSSYIEKAEELCPPAYGIDFRMSLGKSKYR